MAKGKTVFVLIEAEIYDDSTINIDATENSKDHLPQISIPLPEGVEIVKQWWNGKSMLKLPASTVVTDPNLLVWLTLRGDSPSG